MSRIVRVSLIWCMLSLPVVLLGIVMGSPALVYVGLGMMLAWMALPVLDNAWFLWVLSKVVPHAHLVRTMDHDHEERYVLAYGEPGKVLTGHVYWLAELGELTLYANGLCTAPSYVSFWQYVNKEQAVAQQLTHGGPDWHQLRQMTWRELATYRQSLVYQITMKS